MARTMIVTLDKPARKGGADKYTNKEGDFTPYIPQRISRAAGSISQSFKITIEEVD